VSGYSRASVSQVLANGRQLREELNRNLNNNINNNIKKNKDSIFNLEKIQNIANEMSLDIDSEIKDRDDIKELEEVIKKFENEKAKIKKMRPETLFDEISKKERIEDEIESLNKQIEEISKRAYWDSYNDYNEANRINSQYWDENNKLNTLPKEINRKLQINTQRVFEAESILRNLENIQKEFKIRTKNIINSNKFAYVKELFDTIDKNIAQKFMADEYKNLEKEFFSVDKNNIEHKFSFLKSNLENFIEELRNRYNTFLFKKEKAENIFKEFEETQSGYNLNSIESYIKNKEDLMDMYSFAEAYKVNGVSREDFEANLNKINKLIQEEKFDEAYLLTEKANENLIKEQDILSKEYERILKQTEYAKRVAEAGRDAGYNIKISASEDGIQDGINIKLTMGDEIIDFEPRIDGEGNYSLDINHKESVSGTCQHKMTEVMKNLLGKGVLISDIIKEGQSLVFKEKLRNAEKKNKKETLTK
jgi:viral A-type inclusion protein, putative